MSDSKRSKHAKSAFEGISRAGGTRNADLREGAWIWHEDDELVCVPAEVVRVEGGEILVRLYEDKAPGAMYGEEVVTLALSAAPRGGCGGETSDPGWSEADASYLDGVPNMIRLGDFHLGAILHNMRVRLRQGKIYSSIGDILVAVNPYEPLPGLYGKDVMQRYIPSGRDGSVTTAGTEVRGGGGIDEPHIYQTAMYAYSQMMRPGGRDQSVIISGESGAGKTETMKLTLQFLAECASGGDGLSPVEQRILESNPILEAFGNAATLRNDNSSRFGKWTEIFFDRRTGVIRGAKITNYLLEKVRVVRPTRGERNYHIFYYLCSGLAAGKLPSKLAAELGLSSAADHAYLAGRGALLSVATIDDGAEFDRVLAALELFDMDVEERDDAFRVLAGILHLGDVRFDDAGNDASALAGDDANKATFTRACTLLGLDPTAFETAMCQRTIGRGSAITECVKPRTQAQATDARDALAKALYEKLFDWIVARLNRNIAAVGEIATSGQVQSSAAPYSPSSSIAAGVGGTDASRRQSTQRPATIGVLDIFGFEVFEENSYEQMNINYANEKLQSHFNRHIFKEEQKAAAVERIDFAAVTFEDNQPTIDLFEDNDGVYAMLDQSILTNGDDCRFLANLQSVHKHKPPQRRSSVLSASNRSTPYTAAAEIPAKPPAQQPFYVPLRKPGAFGVKHYAGDVAYSVGGFVEKNRDTLDADVMNLILSTTRDFCRRLFSDAKGPGTVSRKSSSSSGARPPSLGKRYQAQLRDLMASIEATDPHFVRCIKPNASKAPRAVDAALTTQQLKYAGFLEAIRIRRLGYPMRLPLRAFVDRYRVLSPHVVFPSMTPRQQCEALMQELGAGRLSFRTSVSAAGAAPSDATRRSRVSGGNEADNDSNDDDSDSDGEGDSKGPAVIKLPVGPPQGCQIGVTRVFLKNEHVALLDSLRDEARKAAVQRLQNLARWRSARGEFFDKVTAMRKSRAALDGEDRDSSGGGGYRDVDKLVAAVAASRDAGLDNAVTRMLSKVADEASALVSRLAAARAAADPARLKQLLGDVVKLRLAGTFIITARDTLHAIEKIETRLADAVATGNDLNELEECLVECNKLGYHRGPHIDEATTLRDRLRAAMPLEATLQRACRNRRRGSLENGLDRAAALGLEGSIVDEAKLLLARLVGIDKIKDGLRRGIAARDLSLLEKHCAAARAAGPSGDDTPLPADDATLRTALDLLTGLRKEAKVKADLTAATEAADLVMLEETIAAAEAAGLSTATCAELEAACTCRSVMIEESGVRRKLSEAIASQDVSELQDAIDLSTNMGFSDDLVDNARGLLVRLGEREAAAAILRSAIESRDVSALTAALERAEAVGLGKESSGSQQGEVGNEKGREDGKDQEGDLLVIEARGLVEGLKQLSQSLQACRLARTRSLIAEALGQARRLQLQDNDTRVTEMVALDVAVERENTAKTQLRLATSKEAPSLDLIGEAMKVCRSVGVAEDSPEMVEATAVCASIVDDAHRRATDLDARLADRDADVARLEARVNALETDLEASRAATAAAESKSEEGLKNLREEGEAHAAARQKIASLELTVRLGEDRVNGLEASVAQQRQLVASMQAGALESHEKVTATLADLHAAKSDVEKQLFAANSKCQQTELTLAAESKRLVDANQVIEAAATELDAARAAHTASLEVAAAEKKALETTITDLEKSLRHERAELTEVRRQLEARHAENEQLLMSLHMAQEQAAFKDEEVTELSTILQEKETKEYIEKETGMRIQGWLEKVGGKLNTTRRRFFLVKGGCLFYYGDDSTDKPLGVVPLSQVYVRSLGKRSNGFGLELFSSLPGGKIRSSKRKNSTMQPGHHETLTLYAENQLDHDHWLSTLGTVIKENNPNQPHDPPDELLQSLDDPSSSRRISMRMGSIGKSTTLEVPSSDAPPVPKRSLVGRILRK